MTSERTISGVSSSRRLGSGPGLDGGGGGGGGGGLCVVAAGCVGQDRTGQDATEAYWTSSGIEGWFL